MIKVYDLRIAGERRNFSQMLYEVIAYSLINLLLLSWPLLYLIKSSLYESHLWLFSLALIGIILIFPAGLVLLYVKLLGFEWLATRIIHPIKRPWDFVFAKRDGTWVIITLKTGEKIAGVFGRKSYASSFPVKEQIYLQETWLLDENQAFLQPVPGTKGILILGEEIRSIEFL